MKKKKKRRITKRKIYRKDAYIKHFKAILAKFLKNKLNDLIKFI